MLSFVADSLLESAAFFYSPGWWLTQVRILKLYPRAASLIKKTVNPRPPSLPRVLNWPLTIVSLPRLTKSRKLCYDSAITKGWKGAMRMDIRAAFFDLDGTLLDSMVICAK